MALAASLVFACAVCGAAETTLPSNGSELPFEGRKRAKVELRAASFVTTDRALRVVELRAQPGLAMAVGALTLVDAEVPVLRRTLSTDSPPGPGSFGAARANSERSSATSLGDVELRATHTAWRSAPAPVTRRLSISAGVKLPTAPLEHDPAGRLVHPDLQPGCGAIVPVLALSHGWSAARWSAWASTTLLFPISVRAGVHAGDSLRGSFTVQMQSARILATRLGVHGRLEGTGELDGEVVRRSGGATVHVAPEIVLSPVGDVVASLGASFPVVQGMRGYRATMPVLLASVGVDF
jgi:hypothetical protein